MKCPHCGETFVPHSCEDECVVEDDKIEHIIFGFDSNGDSIDEH